MASHNALSSPDSYTIAWIAALPIERAAAEAMLDDEHAAPTGFIRHQTDANVYTWGRVGEHNIVIASLAAGVYGTTSAATTASNLLASLPSIRVGLLVGIGGGIARPDEGRDIRLGDVVVSQPGGTTGGVCQYDMIEANHGDRRERKGFLGRPPAVLLNALASIQADHERKDSKIPCFLQEMLEKNPKMNKRSKQNPGYAHQGFDNDRLFKASCDHIPGPDCRGCDKADEVQRDPRDTTDPNIHYGTIASGNTLVKDAAVRDRIVADLGEDCICFEMEAAGLMNPFPCLVIRGICDYADSHKNDRWQRYASATAAAYAKELLAYVPAAEVQGTKKALEVLQLVQQQIDGVQQTTVATKAATDSIRSDLHTDKIRRWLCPPDPSTNANHARTLRHEGTNAWLLENPVFQSWDSGSRRHLWLHGLAGCGKTVLSATVLDHLAKGNDDLILSFFFDFNDTTKQTLDGMLRSLAFQLYQGEVGCAIYLDALFQAHQKGKDQPTTKALSDIVFKMLLVQKKVSIVLDALDESKTRDDVLLWIKEQASKPELGHVQLLYTGRPESEFLRDIPPLIGMPNCLPLDKQAINTDIRSWVTAQLSQRRDFTEKPLSQDLLEMIRRKVGDGADGMFRWAFCQLDSLARCRHEAAMEEALASLPLNLNETYRRMIASIPTELKNDAIRLLQFLVHSKRPLELAEAKEVIATQIENEPPSFDIKRRLFCETDVLAYCPSLVTVDHAAGKELHLAHFSVKEYLLGEYQFEVTTASISITRTCLTYLTDINGSPEEIEQDFPMARYAAGLWTGHAALAQTSEDIGPPMTLREYRIRDQNYPLYSYSAKNWGYHARQAYTEVEELVHAFLKNGSAWKNSLQALREDRFFPLFRQTILKDVSMMHSAAWFGLDECIVRLLNEGYFVDSADDDGQTPLHWAIRNQQVSTVKLLLKQKARVNLVDKEGKSALHHAINRRETDLLQVLGSRNPNLELADVKGRTPLLTAVEASSIDGTKYLLDIGANPAVINFKQQNVLHLAALTGTDEALELTTLLLPHCAHPNAIDLNNMTPLHYSVAKGNKELSKFLLQNGVDINTGVQRVCEDHPTVQRSIPDMLPRDQQGSSSPYEIHGLTPLHFAALAAHLSMIDFLLSEGANVNARCSNGDSPLHLTLRKSLLDVDKIISSNPSDLPFGYIPMDDAWSDNPWQIESLLEIKDDDDSENAAKIYDTISLTRMKCVDILIAHPDIDVGLRNTLGETPMHVIPFGQENSMAIFSKLANKSQDIFATDNKGQTPLHIACLKSDRDVANYLLDVDPLSVFKLDLQELSPLHYAIRSWDVTLVTMLLSRVAEQDGARAGNQKRGRPLLHFYLEEPFCRPEMVRALLAYGENVNLISHGNSPLSIYLRSPHFEEKTEICQLLIEEGANPLWTNSQGENLAHVYMHTTVQDCQVLRALRDSSLDIFGKDHNKKSILHHAAIHGTVSRGLVGALPKCSIHSLWEPDCENLTPLMYAERNARQDDHGAETSDDERWQITLDLLQMMENDTGEQDENCAET